MSSSAQGGVAWSPTVGSASFIVLTEELSTELSHLHDLPDSPAQPSRGCGSAFELGKIKRPSSLEAVPWKLSLGLSSDNQPGPSQFIIKEQNVLNHYSLL